MSGTNLALFNLRGIVIIIVLAFHSVLAYLRYGPAAAAPLNEPPYRWLAFPIVDGERWFGFDLFCAHQDIYLISLMFFLSGLFVWKSLARKGAGKFVADRLLRLGLPFALVVTLMMPIATYPAYRVAAVDPSIAAYWQHFVALPFWPNGPPWFLPELLVFDVAAAALFALAPATGGALARLAAQPARFVVVLLAASAIAYIPLALAFTPSEWKEIGPFGFQLSRPLHYAVYFFAGIAVGTGGFERGLLAADGYLARRWRIALAAAAVTYVAWLGSAGLALAMAEGGAAPLAIQLLAAICFVLSCGAGCLAFLALVLRFAIRRLPALDMASENAYGLYLIHYVFVVWLQYLLLGAPLPAVLKGAIVFAGTLLFSLGAIALICRIPLAARIIGSEGRAVPTTR